MKLRRLILSFVFLFVFMFGLASCGGKCETHEFSEWQVVEAPTDSKKGSATRTCSKCKEVETLELPILSEADYTITGVEGVDCTANNALKYTLKINTNIVISTSGHIGDIYCEKCGLSLVPDTFYTNMTTASNYTSFTLKLDNITIDNMKMNIKDAEAEVQLGQTFDDIKVFGKATITNTTTPTMVGNYKFEYEKNILYYSTDVTGTTVYGQKDISSIIEVVKTVLTKIDAYFKNKETKTIDNAQILAFIKKVCKTGHNDDKYSLKLDSAKVRALNADLKNKSIKEITGLNLDTYKPLVVAMIDYYSITGLVNMLDMFMSGIFDKVENALTTVISMVPQGVLPMLLGDSLDTVYTPAKLVVKLLEKQGITNEKLTAATTIKEVVCALDSSVDQGENKVVASADLVRLFKITKLDGESDSNAIFRTINALLDQSFYTVICGLLKQDVAITYALVDKAIDEVLNNTIIPELFINKNGIIDSGVLQYVNGNAKTTITLKINDHITPVSAKAAQ